MYLVVTATDFEMKPVIDSLASTGITECLVVGVGPVETVLRLSVYLYENRGKIDGVVNAGVAGAYVGAGVDLLDICLADREVFGDIGICSGDEITQLDTKKMSVQTEFSLDNDLTAKAVKILSENKTGFSKGSFVTVNCTSGTRKRGDYLRRKYQAICENMEGAAVARVCREYQLPCVELRCVSNMVEDRDPGKWKLEEACRKSGKTAALLINALNAGK